MLFRSILLSDSQENRKKHDKVVCKKCDGHINLCDNNSCVGVCFCEVCIGEKNDQEKLESISF